MRSRRLLGAALAALALFGAACGSGDDDGEGDRNSSAATDSTAADNDGEGDVAIEVCTLLTDDEAAEVIGGPASSGPGTGPGESVCTWSDDQGRTVTISVGSSGTAPGDEFDPARVTGLGTADPVAGFDGAFYVGIGTVAFASDDRLHTVQVATGATADADRASAEELAPLVAERIADATA